MDLDVQYVFFYFFLCIANVVKQSPLKKTTKNKTKKKPELILNYVDGKRGCWCFSKYPLPFCNKLSQEAHETSATDDDRGTSERLR